MSNKIDLRFQLVAATCGPIFIIGYLIFWGILGHNIPPPSSGYTPEQLVANYFGKYHDDIMLGMVISAVVGIIYLPWSSELCVIMRRKEHRQPVLSNIELLGGGITAWLLAECPAIWAHAAHYGTSNPVLTEMLWRQSWYIYDLTYLITTVQMLGCGFYALTDRSPYPVFPRWAGLIAIGSGLTFLPLCAIAYENDGPLALNGWWNFFIVFGTWLVWFGVYSFYMIRHIRRQLALAQREPAVEPVQPTGSLA